MPGSPAPPSLRPAVFLDRDGTLIRDPGFLSLPEQVELLPGTAAAIGRLNAAGWLTVVITNQSGIARGLISLDAHHAIEDRLAGLLAAEGARLDAQFFCPHLPELTGACDCRKPALGLFRAAGDRLGVDYAQSWCVGNRLRDASPALGLGARGMLLTRDDSEPEALEAAALGIATASDLSSAVGRIVGAP